MRAFDTIIPFLKDSLSDKGSVIHLNDHARIKLRQDGFRPLSRSCSSLVFVDGGNGEILKGPNISVQFCRLAAVSYQGKSRVDRSVIEFFVVVVAKKKDLDVVFDVRIFDVGGNQIREFMIDSLDPSLRQGDHRASAYSVGNHARIVEELRFSRTIMKGLKDSILVRDGDLLLSGPLVVDELRKLRLASEKLGIPVLGLSKTSNLVTDVGASAVSAVSALAPAGCWCFFSDGMVGFTKLHSASRYVFRFDVFSHDRDRLQDILSALVFVSDDPVFLGYPYGLVDADLAARVSEQEVRQLRARFSLKSRDSFAAVEAAVDAHDLLNTL